MKRILLAAAAAALSVSASGQNNSSVIAESPTANAVLRAGTPISLKLLQQVTTKKKAARVGQRVNLEVAAPVEVNGVTVIPAGSPAWGEITDVRNKGMWGKSGHLEMRALYARVNGRQIRLSGTIDDKGVTGTAGVVGAVALMPLAGFFLTGTSAELPLGATFPAFIDEDVELAIRDIRPAPMVVGGTQPAPMVVGEERTPAPVEPAPERERVTHIKTRS